MENICRIAEDKTYKKYSATDENIYPFRLMPKVDGRRRVVLLGATGSVGSSTLEVIRKHGDKLQLVGIAGGSRESELNAVADEFGVSESVLFSRDGEPGLEYLATLPEADIVLVATTGTAALRAVLAALEAGKDVALANKETLVAGGHLVKAAEQKSAGRVFPVDSEHNAIFQCLEGNRTHGSIKRLLLTASGGAFRDKTLEELKNVTVDDALLHPNWSMGPKITVDCATMANKGLEMIEACRLFDVEPSQIDVVVHPQSIVHSMVEFCDNSIIAQMSKPSMTFAIQHILMYPERKEGIHESLDFSKMMNLEFRPPDEKLFPCLRLARQSLEAGGIYPLSFNAANEVAVDAFMHRGLPFLSIPAIIEEVLENVHYSLPDTVDELIDTESRIQADALKRLTF
ncbi:MAG: 1-deoxy-D-xylulose-5-phosphate reductoisomerase [Spirochaetales bacterium]|uniref:1-deoxy-D-xylulose 5-phosphate reductoisomerase n=1 Tax=Candidatus Thalassospirochaeta sargassi TaxID=3119039 RepID=A0AAJ1MJM7_9SPIO|nr:1-deoxy-D-xylulose-5-phosphate reductoisomerase [Spirochaetales bacterium]